MPNRYDRGIFTEFSRTPEEKKIYDMEDRIAKLEEMLKGKNNTENEGDSNE